MALYLELDQCSNSRTHQDLAPTKTHMEVHYCQMESKHKEWKNIKDKPNKKWKWMKLHRTDYSKQSWKYNSNRYKWKEITSNANLPNGIGRTWRKSTYRRSLLDFENWKNTSRHLVPWSKISDGVPPLEAHHCSQDKAKEEENSRLTISLQIWV